MSEDAKKKALYEKKLRAMLDEDRHENPAAVYEEDPELIDAVNKVTTSGVPLRRNRSDASEEQIASDKKAYQEMMSKRKKKGY